ncbi:hypothetical protein POM88_037114 [Heracleum sosnowskyi]|uniref:Uncharacterized protein n=1 Tax=Heracleum sosnowskyi TaxID=360622 RepID=A0AAD8HRH2_9APIA|nr:hypothetical protein POM88_037114 [Heracleum sosnowskyi]
MLDYFSTSDRQFVLLLLLTSSLAWFLQGKGVDRAEITELKKLLQNESSMRKAAEEEIANLKSQLHEFTNPEAGGNSCILELHKMLEEETHKRKGLEEEVLVLQSHLSQQTLGAGQSQFAHSQLRDGYDRDGALMTNLHEQDIDEMLKMCNRHLITKGPLESDSTSKASMQ